MATAPVEGMGPRRGLSAKGWLLVVALAVASLVVVLIGVALLDEPGGMCSCSPVQRPSESASAAQ
jgi:hypothetical protein